MMLFILAVILCCVLVGVSKKNNATRNATNVTSANLSKDLELKKLDQLSKMKDLLDKGAITQEEFDAYKSANKL